MTCTANWLQAINCRGCERHGKRGYAKCGICGTEVEGISKETPLEFARCFSHSERGQMVKEKRAAVPSEVRASESIERPLIVYCKSVGGASIRKLATVFSMETAIETAKAHRGRAWIQRQGSSATFDHETRKARLAS